MPRLDQADLGEKAASRPMNPDPILTGILHVECNECLQVDDRDASQEQVPGVSYILLHVCCGRRQQVDQSSREKIIFD